MTKSSSPTGPAPFGYERVANCFRRQESEAQIRARVFKLFVVERKKRVVAQSLNAEGHRARSGTIFSAQAVGRILTDPIVLGVPGKIEQIVDQDLWDRCQDILAEQKAAGGAKRSTRHLFAGLLYCQCGQKMYVPSSSKKYVCGDCRAKIVSADLEAVFVKHAINTIKATGVQSALQDWSALPFSTKRELVETLCDRITVDGKSITISLGEI